MPTTCSNGTHSPTSYEICERTSCSSNCGRDDQNLIQVIAYISTSNPYSPPSINNNNASMSQSQSYFIWMICRGYLYVTIEVQATALLALIWTQTADSLFKNMSPWWGLGGSLWSLTKYKSGQLLSAAHTPPRIVIRCIVFLFFTTKHCQQKDQI